MKLNLERNVLLPIYGLEELGILKFAYFEPFSCGLMIMYNIEKYHRIHGIKAVESVFDSIRDKTKFRDKSGWNTNLIQFSITDRNNELVDLCNKYCCNNTGFYLNYNSGNNIAVFTIECGTSNKD
jgi:hypothetical protein